MRSLLLAFLLAAGAAHAQVTDDFERIGAWQAVASDGVRASVHGVPGHEGQALRLDFDFGGAAGYAAARRALPLDFGADYEISFWLRADAPLNNLEFKLVDASGDNVWWVNRPNFAISREWQLVKFKKRHVKFAWGPLADHTLRHTEKLELVVSAGRDGGHGSVYFDQLNVKTLDAAGPAPAPVFIASSGQVINGGWTSAAGGEQQMTVDFGRPREFGGLILHWAQPATRYDIDFSDDGRTWRTARRVTDGNGGTDPLLLHEAETRFLRIAAHAGPADRYRLERLEIKDLDFGESPNAFFQALAKTAPLGSYPRGMSGQQNYWTVLGVDGGHETGLLSEDGALEVARGGFSVEPFVVEGGKRSSWADVKVSQSLRENYLPIPSVTWSAPKWTLRTTAFAHGTPDRSGLAAQYEVANLTNEPLQLRLVLALRPFQVNPPMQFLNTPPGVSPIHDIAWDGAAFSVDGRRRVFAQRAPDAAGVSSFDAGGDGFGTTAVHDDTGFASGALAYDIRLSPRAVAQVGLTIPMTGEPQPASDLRALQDAVAASWRERLNRVAITVPPRGQAIVDTVRSSLAHMLMTRDGPMLRPGTRSYARSWIRDGAMMSEAMLRFGDDKVARDYLEWFAPHQFADGKVPCCVDKRGADPVPENDSQGEFIFLNAQLWKYTQDRALLERMWPRVMKAAAFMEAQRQSERTEAQRGSSLFGLLPASISHEGYSAKPMHSYWDDFWGLRGYRDAAMLAQVLGKPEAASLGAQAGEFERELFASLRLSASEHKVGYLPGAAELGDFDATSTTIALSPGGLQERLPQDLLAGTFERYWQQFVARRDGKLEWKDYTPYELRNVAAFVRLGWRDRAHELLDFFLRDRRPAAWNQWAEVVGRDAREPRFVGDMPHGWISSDYIRSALDLFAYERESDHALVLGAGLPRAWLAGEGVAVRGLRTAYGKLGYRVRERSGRIVLDIDAGMTVPPGGIIVRAANDRPGRATINGRAAPWQAGELRIGALPATVIIEQSTSKARP
ncbi:discoidin domain-containing protein [Massilia sp. R2A-15]|uniref:discoidin domain-containing protein n=1 Tax=Massilia sp. R2A-15 TaxID=3064278 RepID=UPI00273574EA|nr:discoidin domain-containing protein [Massilia sp. R2A-15]WLI91635.1 discoidin domain-containing protein [Massilia sp. R2A-15]